MASDLISNDLEISPSIEGYLAETAKWGKFLAIVGFVLTGIFIILAFTFTAFLSSTMRDVYGADLVGPLGSGGMMINFFIMAAVIFFPSMFLLRFANRMKEAINDVNQGALENSFENLKSLFKFYGIITLIVLGIYALAFVFIFLALLF
ncbi:MAG: hypothetical protein J5I50_12620 [Chitinophagaceae bacterium]|nr:hypothetical protein [Chitinophagaceae bacterium]